MSDDDIPSTDPATLPPSPRTLEVVKQAEIDDVLGDERLSPAERLARLGDLRQRLLDNEYADGDEEYAPLEARIMDALSMLAEGGHDYGGSLRVEGEDVVGRGDPFDDDDAEKRN